VSSYRQQTLIEAPLTAVWQLVGDPRRYPEWAGDVVEVTGLPEVEQGAQFEQTTKTPVGNATTPYLVEALDDLREIRLRCLKSGYYSRWLLTEAGDDTFCEVEVGMDPKTLPYRALNATVGRRWYRSTVTDWLERIHSAAGR
jgi:hypothetical protein